MRTAQYFLVGIVACVGALIVWGSAHGWTTRRHYLISPLHRVAEVDVVDNMSHVVGRIIDEKEVAAIVAFMNARRDNWYDPEGGMFGTGGDLELLDAHGKRRASMFFGGGGMMLTRPDMTYRDSVRVHELLVFRTIGDTEGDAATLCALLSHDLHKTVCSSPGEFIDREDAGQNGPTDCGCERLPKRSTAPSAPASRHS